MKKILKAVALMLVITAAMAGCGKTNPVQPTEEATEISTTKSEENVQFTDSTLEEKGTEVKSEVKNEEAGEVKNEQPVTSQKGDEDSVQAVITMESGDTITLELYPDIAPITVANFKTLCEEGFYDGLTFHRIISGFMIQGGDPLGNGTGGPGYTIKGEFEANGVANPLQHTRGVISMARSQSYDSAGSQFFIMHEDSPHLDGQYAAFGKVIEGIEVVDKIAETAVYFDGQTPLEPVVIESIKIVE